MPAASPRPDQKAMLKELKAETGAAFDKDYVSQQLKAHQEALDLQMSYAQGGDDSNLKGAATEIVPVVPMHLA